MALGSKHPCLPLLLFLILLSLIHLSSTTDTISATNPSLSGSQTLTSQQGNFVLGFFKPGKSSFSYIGIWYKKVSIQTPVWVANRATPISDPTASNLTIFSDGNLVLLNPSKNITWSTNINSSTSNTEAVLMDSGNLVLRDSTNTSNVLWQSIEHPTHTFLPGGKLARNHLTGVSQRLTSWKNSDDPSPGSYSLEIDPDGSSQYLLQWNRSVTFWSSGLWDRTSDIFTNVPEMTQAFVYTYQYINNSQENYFTYSVKSDAVISRFEMDISGQVRQFTWVPLVQRWSLFWSQPKVQCDVYAFCGAFGSCNENETPFCNCVEGFVERSPEDLALNDHTGGCVRRTPLQCGSGLSAKADKDKFLPKPNMGLPDNPVSLKATSVGDCEAACLNNCSCSAYTYNYNSTDADCSVWYGDLLNLQELSSGSGCILYLRLAASELQSHKSNKVTISPLAVGVGVGVGVGAGVLAFVVIVWVMICMRRRRRLISTSKAAEGGIVSFRYSDLVRATKNFSEKLGGGGFGSVFKGKLPSSSAIAVKMLEGLGQGETQFRAEVSTIGTIHHVNLVCLRGFCSEGDKKLLVYDYMPNGSLDSQLFQGSSTVLHWKTRYQIAIGIARGLVHLHEKCRECIIHYDIKPENIVLDASFIPKVADFGLAKLVGRDFSRVLTTMRGNKGYLAPEWISGVAITAKVDVYSYGMLLFEIISGRRNSETLEGGQKSFYPKIAAAKLVEGDMLGLLDYKLGGDANLEEVSRACKVACWCIQDNEDSRPSMGQVTQILEGVLEIGMPPTPMSLQIFGDNGEDIVFFSDLSSNQTSHTQSSTSTNFHSKSTSPLISKD